MQPHHAARGSVQAAHVNDSTRSSTCSSPSTVTRHAAGSEAILLHTNDTMGLTPFEAAAHPPACSTTPDLASHTATRTARGARSAGTGTGSGLGLGCFFFRTFCVQKIQRKHVIHQRHNPCLFLRYHNFCTEQIHPRSGDCGADTITTWQAERSTAADGYYLVV